MASEEGATLDERDSVQRLVANGDTIEAIAIAWGEPGLRRDLATRLQSIFDHKDGTETSRHTEMRADVLARVRRDAAPHVAAHLQGLGLFGGTMHQVARALCHNDWIRVSAFYSFYFWFFLGWGGGDV